MSQYEVEFTVNGKRTSQVVSATTADNARRIIKAQYPNADIVFYHTRRL